MEHYKSFVVDGIFPAENKDAGKYSDIPIEAINRCFSGSTMEEIVDVLQKENTVWAKETLQSFRTKSPLSLKVFPLFFFISNLRNIYH